jgi:hypothetical protein
MLIGPMLAGDNPEKVMVEPPGIAPGSSPLIARAFISIVRPKPDPLNIGAIGERFQMGRSIDQSETPVGMIDQIRSIGS